MVTLRRRRLIRLVFRIGRKLFSTIIIIIGKSRLSVKFHIFMNSK